LSQTEQFCPENPAQSKGKRRNGPETEKLHICCKNNIGKINKKQLTNLGINDKILNCIIIGKSVPFY